MDWVKMAGDELLRNAFLVVAAEELARQFSDKVITPSPATTNTPTTTVKQQAPETYFIDLRNIAINGRRYILQKKGQGTLQEFVIKSESNNFDLELIKDEGDPIIFNDYEYYQAISEYVECIDVFEDEDNDLFIFKINDINFTKSILLSIYTTQAVKFSIIFAKYEIS